MIRSSIKRNLKCLKRSIFAIMLALLMVITAPGVAQAKEVTKTTSVRSTIGTYTEYVRKADSTTELGQMTLARLVSGIMVTHRTEFKATLTCNRVTAYTSYKSGDWSTETKAPLKNGRQVIAYSAIVYSSESVAKTAKTYGKCSVAYPE